MTRERFDSLCKKYGDHHLDVADRWKSIEHITIGMDSIMYRVDIGNHVLDESVEIDDDSIIITGYTYLSDEIPTLEDGKITTIYPIEFIKSIVFKTYSYSKRSDD